VFVITKLYNHILLIKVEIKKQTRLKNTNRKERRLKQGGEREREGEEK
jgi:hypothetical protein